MDTKKVIGSRINEALAFSNKKQKELAAHLGVPDNTISYFCSGKRVPNAEQIIKISKFLGVSSDFLLGIAKEKTLNPKLQSACEYTGLNEEAIEKLKESCNIHSNIGNGETFKILNWLLSESYIEEIAIELKYVKEKSESYLRLKKDLNENYPNGFPNEPFISRLPITDKEYITYLNLESLIHNTELECDVSRYNIIKIIEKLSNYFDKRENSKEYEEYKKNDLKILFNQIEMERLNGEHNPPKE